MSGGISSDVSTDEFDDADSERCRCELRMFSVCNISERVVPASLKGWACGERHSGKSCFRQGKHGRSGPQGGLPFQCPRQKSKSQRFGTEPSSQKRGLPQQVSRTMEMPANTLKHHATKTKRKEGWCHHKIIIQTSNRADETPKKASTSTSPTEANDGKSHDSDSSIQIFRSESESQFN